MIKKIIFSALFITSLITYAQEDYSKTIDNTIKEFFEDFHKQDTISLKNYFDDSASLQSVIKLKDGTTKIVNEPIAKFVTSIGSIPDSTQFEERIFKSTINFSKGLAHAFVPYQFYVNQKLSHCGVNSFIFAQVENKWLITNIIDTRKRNGCETITD